jgi:peroxiredoxin
MAKLLAGERLPSFTFDTHLRDGLESLSVLKGKTVFWVLRYIGCTVCRYDVHLIAQRYEEFKAKGAQVFVVMQSDRDHVQKDLSSTDTVLPFEIICDPDQKIYNMLSIEPAESMEALAGGNMDALKEKGAKARECGFTHGDYEGNEQQLPAMFIADEDGTVLYAHYAQNIVDMPSVDEVIEML